MSANGNKTNQAPTSESDARHGKSFMEHVDELKQPKRTITNTVIWPIAIMGGVGTSFAAGASGHPELASDVALFSFGAAVGQEVMSPTWIPCAKAAYRVYPGSRPRIAADDLEAGTSRDAYPALSTRSTRPDANSSVATEKQTFGNDSESEDEGDTVSGKGGDNPISFVNTNKAPSTNNTASTEGTL